MKKNYKKSQNKEIVEDRMLFLIANERINDKTNFLSHEQAWGVALGKDAGKITGKKFR